MKVKVFETNHNGKIEFTRAELEKLLNEVYTEGYRDGESSGSWTWTKPYLNNALRSNDTATITTCNTKIDKDTLNQIAGTTSIAETPKTFTTTTDSTKPNTYTVTMKCNEADINKAADALRELLNSPGTLSTKAVDDAFSKLTKELNF